jgi:hypothetical protein
VSDRKEEGQLVDLLKQAAGVTAVKAVVDAVGGGADAGTVSLFLRGETTPITLVRYMDSYAPTAGDVVWCLKIGPNLIVLGKLADRP